MYQNKHDITGQNSVDGNNAEELFRELAEAQGYTITDASRSEQFAHIDFWLEKDGNKWSAEVKARKKMSRKDENYRDDILWVEHVGVNGKDGWLRTGANILVLEQENEFLIVERKKLRELVDSLVDFTKVVDRAKNALNATFRRFKRKDLISIVEMAKVREIVSKSWPKTTNTESTSLK